MLMSSIVVSIAIWWSCGHEYANNWNRRHSGSGRGWSSDKQQSMIAHHWSTPRCNGCAQHVANAVFLDVQTMQPLYLCRPPRHRCHPAGGSSRTSPSAWQPHSPSLGRVSHGSSCDPLRQLFWESARSADMSSFNFCTMPMISPLACA